MIPQLSDVLALIYAITLAMFSAIAIHNSIYRVFLGNEAPPPTEKPTKWPALEKIYRQAPVCLAWTMGMMWLLDSQYVRPEPIYRLLFSADYGWRLYVLLSVFGVSIVLCAAGNLFNAIVRSVKVFASRKLDQIFPTRVQA